MVLPHLRYNFHDAGVTTVTAGPRHEVMLVVGLDDPTYPPHNSVYIRFGGVTNFAEVTTFLEQVPPAKAQDAYVARIDGLDYDPEEQSRQHNLVFRLALDMIGQVRIYCRNVTEGPASDLGSRIDPFT
jgi:hypothetical protein